MVMNAELKKQLKYIYLYTFFSGMMFWYGIEQLFLETIGDGVFVRGVSLAVFSLTLFLFNIPAGAISDIWGRVRSLKIALLAMALGLLVLGLSQNVWHYAVGSFVFGLFWAFDEGAKEAFVYDSLYDSGEQKKYQRILGRIYAVLLVGAASANFLSGPLSELTSLRSTYFFSVVPCILALYFVSKLHEPDHHKQVGKKILRQLDDAAKAIAAHKVLFAVVVAQTLIYIGSSISAEFAQPAIVEHTDSAILLGIAWGIMGLVMAAGNLGAHRVQHIFRFIIILLVMMAAYVVFRDSWLSLIPLFIFVAGMEAVSIRGEGAIQANTTSHLRATISSIPSSASMLLVAFLSLWVGESEGTVAVRIFLISFPALLMTGLLWFQIRTHIPND